ncbi:hypothetical protein [Lysinibacillus sp. JNUCC-52]|uniref:hypothetical protein n=1 Tax=Lysinibacillus sp. JNUCC-52 TaxID=2792480 RepID=UPI0019390308|nr:hypothetical protein JNUCC52_00995 [Lysinibacillus sp. JNUCC-52]
MNILSTIVATGIPGFLSYIYLNRLGILNYTKDEKDEKIIVLSIFSLINIGVSIVVFYYLTGKKFSKNLDIESYLFLFLIAVVVSFILTLYIYPLVMKMGNKYIDNFQKNNHIANKSTKTVYESVLFRKDKKYPFIFIFDFDNKFIESGFAHRLSGASEKLNISITNTTGHIKETYTIYEVLEKFENHDNESAEIIIDVENKLKVFVFYS